MGTTLMRDNIIKKISAVLAAILCITLFSNALLLPTKAEIPNELFSYTKEYRIQSANDDCAVTATSVNLTSTGVYLHGVHTGNVLQDNYLRFTGVELPEDAAITEAYLSFTVRDASKAPTTVQITGETSGAAAFGNTLASFSNRTYTTAGIEMTTPASITAGMTLNTPDLSVVMNEIRASSTNPKDYVFRIIGNKTGNAIMRSYNSSSTLAPKLVVNYTSSIGVFTYAIANAVDKGQEYGNDRKTETSGSLKIGGYRSSTLSAANKQVCGLRFSGIVLPQDAEIVEAYMEFTDTASGSSGIVSNMVIKAEIGNAEAYKTTASNISGRSYGALSVSYQQPSLQSGQVVRTPNLKAIIDENRLMGWQSGQAMAFMIDGDNYIGAVYEGPSSNPPRFIIKYRIGTGGPVSNDPSDLRNIYINEVSNGTDSCREPWIEFYNDNDAPVMLDKDVFLTDDENMDKYEFRYFMIPAGGYRTLYLNGSEANGFVLDNTDAYITVEDENNGDDDVKVNDVSGIIINQVYGSGPLDNSGSISHSFVELYNPTDTSVNLAECSLQLQNGVDASNKQATEWEKYDFNSSQNIAAHSSFLIRLALAAPAARYVIPDADVDWNSGRIISNRAYSVALVSNHDLLSMIITSDEKAGVVDLVGAVNTPPQDTAMNFEGAQFEGISKQKSLRRIDFMDTDNNLGNFVAIDYRTSGIKSDQLEQLRPRWSGDGAWGVASVQPPDAPEKPDIPDKPPVQALTSRVLTLSALYDGIYHTIDQLSYYSMQFGETYGRFTDGSDKVVKYDNGGTFGASNNAIPLVLTYTVSKESGQYADPIDIVVKTEPVNTVVYTIDGTIPSQTNGSVYSGPIHIDHDAVLRLYIYNAKQNSGVISYAYQIGNNGLELRKRTVSYPITTGNDDLRATATAVNLAETRVFLNGRSGTTDLTSYLRFTGVNLPDDAVITNAYIAFTAGAASSSPTSYIVSGELGAGAAFNSSISSVNGRSYTSSSVTSRTPDSAAVGTQCRTGDLTGILNEMRTFTEALKNYVFKVEGDRIGSYSAYSYEGSGTAPTLFIEFLSGYDEYTGVCSSSDDAAEEYGSSNTIALNSRIELAGYYSVNLTPSYRNIVGLRFPSVTIPADAEITDAFIEFTVYAAAPSAKTNAVANVTIRAEAGNPAAYAGKAFNITSRNYGQMTVSYQQPAFKTANEIIRTADLKDLIDEKRLNNWQSGQAMAFMIDGDNFIGTIYQSNTTYSPKLVIRYQFSSKGPSITGAVTESKLLSNVFVNEVSGEGTSSSKDTWVELYNGNDVPVILDKGVYLSDKASNPSKFQFKNVLIPAKGYRVIICPEVARTDPGYAGFELSSTGTVYLNATNSTGQIVTVDSLAYGAHLYNQTVGRVKDGYPDIVLFQGETFGTSNNNGQQNYKVTVSTDRGVYDSGFNLTVSSSKPSATIKYSINGTTIPGAAAGTVYTGPIAITKSCVVKIYVYDAEGNSGLQAYTYILKDNLKNEVTSGSQWQYKSSITSDEYGKAMSCFPIISITSNTSADLVSNADYVQGTFEYIDAHLGKGNNNYFSNAGSKKFGQETITRYNSNVDIKFHRDYNTKKAKVKFFEPMPEDKFPTPVKYNKLQLKEGQDGPERDVYNLGYLRISDSVGHTLGIQMGKLDLRTRYVQYFFNGKYMGLKTLREAFSDGMFENYFGDDSNNYTVINFKDTSFTSGSLDTGNPALLSAIKKTVSDKNFQEFKKYVDINDFIKFQILFMFVDTENEAEAILHNDAYVSGKVKMITNINDLDGAFYNDGKADTNGHSIVGGGGSYRYKWGLSSSRGGVGGWFAAFSGDSTLSATAGNLEFKTLVKDQVLVQIGPASGDMRGAQGAPLSVDNVQNLIKKNFAELDSNFAYKVDAAYMGARSTIYKDWLGQQPQVVAQVVDRVSYSLNRWAAYGMAHTLSPVTFTDTGSGIILNNPNSTDTYYTTDGSDPMGPNGVISVAAIKYAASTVLPYSAKLTVRPFTTNNWGPITSR